MTLAVLAGVGVGAAIWLLYSGLWPGREPLEKALRRLGNPDAAAPTGETDSFDGRLGAQLRRVTLVERLVDLVRADLRVLRRDPDEQVAEIAAWATAGLLWAPVVATGAWLVWGIRLPWLLPVWLSLLGATGAVVLAVRHVRHRAIEARAEFRHALSAWCDVLAMNLSAGRELHAAVVDASAQGDGWAWQELRSTLQEGFLRREAPWESLTRLGREIRVDDLVELGAALALADDEGAAVADTVASRAASLRERLVSETETKAAAATEQMAVPGAMILVGFLLFIVYPAVAMIAESGQ